MSTAKRYNGRAGKLNVTVVLFWDSQNTPIFYKQVAHGTGRRPAIRNEQKTKD